jgi:uncharacterized protein YecE (DUF72 family)
MACEVRVGTSGWHYRHWKGLFYPEDLPASKMLGWYLERFDSVELNNSFYKLPAKEALAAWRAGTPPGFLFAVKGSRFLTHMKKLKDPEEGVRRFMERVEALGEKLGPILFQLPPFWAVNAERLDAFLDGLPRKRRYAFEFRNPTWHSNEVYAILRRHNAAFCAWELAGVRSPVEITADWTYVRLHGPEGPYQGSYSDSALAGWAGRIRKWRRRLRAVYVYFDNDQGAHAPRNAGALRKLVVGSAYSYTGGH